MRVALLLLALFLSPSVAYAALININTADAALLDTLPGIGPTKANAIIEYRTANGPFGAITEIQNVSGIGSATYADIAPLITVGTSSSSTSSSSTASSSPSTASSTPAASGGVAEYLAIPTLRIQGVKDQIVSVGADTVFTALVYDNKGNRRADALVTWSFGDGTHRTGASVYHAYYTAGEYVVIVRATTTDGGTGESEVLIVAKDSKVSIQEVSAKDVMLANADTRPVDLSGWRIVVGDREFRIPADTFILGEKTLPLSFRVTGLAAVGSAQLLFPNGDLASVYPRSTQVERAQAPLPTPVAQSFSVAPAPALAQVRVAEGDESVRVALAAVGAAQIGGENGEEDSQEGSVISSPWFLSFLGVVLLAGVAFVFI